jgi:hypothetical protein
MQNEAINRELDELRQQIAELTAERERPKFGLFSSVGGHFRKLWRNAITDPQLTIAGVVMGGAVLYQTYPDVNVVDALQAAGISYTGALATSYKPTEKTNEMDELA